MHRSPPPAAAAALLSACGVSEGVIQRWGQLVGSEVVAAAKAGLVRELVHHAVVGR